MLEGRDIPSVAKFLKSDECKNVFLMVRTPFVIPSSIHDD